MKNIIITNLVAYCTLFAGLFSFSASNPVVSVIFLISSFVLAAVYLILIGVQFLGISYIVVYVGAIAVLFLFVIMMIDIDLPNITETGVDYNKNLPLVLIMIFSTFFIFYTLFLYNWNYLPGFSTLLTKVYTLIQYIFNLDVNDFLGSNPNLNSIVKIAPLFLSYPPIPASVFKPLATKNADVLFKQLEQIDILGLSLYTQGAILLIILSLILLLAMFAIIVISKSTKNKNNNNKNV